MVNEGLLAAGQTGAAVADAADGGQVGVMEDRQLHGQTPLHTEGITDKVAQRLISSTENTRESG